jgi:hypothetical protein
MRKTEVKTHFENLHVDESTSNWEDTDWINLAGSMVISGRLLWIKQ